MDVDVLIFGGGAAGLWLLSDLTDHGYAALLIEAAALGTGQTVASQGILHGGLKYTLQGLLTPSAQHVSAMPAIWRECLAGQRRPDLSRTKLRSDFCYLWRTTSLASQLGMIGARIGLQVTPHTVSDAERPAVLKGVPGTVARLDEQVICAASFLNDLRQQLEPLLIQCAPSELQVSGTTATPVFTLPSGQTLRPRTVILTAGAGNAALRESLNLPGNVMQRRPLQMVLVRGDLPPLFGHCVDGARTRATITAAVDSSGRTVWQVGGQISEDGVKLSPADLIQHAKKELAAVLPGLSLTGTEWSTYRVDRAERATPDGRRPETVQVLRDQNVFTAWPTKLVLAPLLADTLREQLPAPVVKTVDTNGLANVARPMASPLPWDEPERLWVT